MQIQIEVVNVQVNDKGKYKEAVVTYRNNGKVQEKKLFSFGDQKDAFAVLSTNPAKNLTVSMEKNDRGYWDWLKVVPTSEATTTQKEPANGASANPSPRSNYETPEERAKRQEYIIRQSSLERAIQLLELQGNKKSTVTDVTKLAAQFENYVFNGLDSVVGPAISNTVVEAIESLEDDIPY